MKAFLISRWSSSTVSPSYRYCDVQKLDARERIGLMRQVLEALSYVHSRKVIHRDLKASNILVDAAGNAKLLDFGTARLADAGGDDVITKSGVFAFTPECASPEQIQGKPLTFATDIYSAGVLLRRLLITPDAPLDAVLSKCLRENPQERYATAAELDADLARYLDGQPVQARRPRKLKWIGVVAAGIGIGAVAGWFALHRSAASETPPSIAVLPFANVGGNPANLYFSDGLTGEITDALSKLKGLRVIARASAFQFRGKENDLRSIGKQLNVTHVLEGSVERSGDQVKIVARLDRVSDVSQIWSSAYERKSADLFSVQSEIANGIAFSLGVPLHAARPASHVVRDPEARDAYLRGFFEVEQITPESLDAPRRTSNAPSKSIRSLLGRLRGLSAVAAKTVGAAVAGVRSLEQRKKVEQLCQKALELDPNVTRARALLGEYAMQYDWAWERAMQEFQAILADGPNADAEQQYGMALVFQGRVQEAEEHLLRAQILNPLGIAQIIKMGLARDIVGRFEEARREFERVLLLHPSSMPARVMIDYIDIDEGRTDRALADFKALEPRFPGAPLFEAMALARAGRKQEALRVIHPLEEKGIDESLSVYWFALVYAYLGDAANTVKWLELSADRREYQTMYIKVQPPFAFLRNDARFHVLKKRIGLDR